MLRWRKTKNRENLPELLLSVKDFRGCDIWEKPMQGEWGGQGNSMCKGTQG